MPANLPFHPRRGVMPTGRLFLDHSLVRYS